MLHSPSGFPSRISCRIIGCDFSSPDTFTYRLLKAVSCKYHVANLYCAGDFWAHTVTNDGLVIIFIQHFYLGDRLQNDCGRNIIFTACRNFLREFRNFSDVGKLIEQESYMIIQTAVRDCCAFVIQRLKHLGEQHRYQEVECAVSLWDNCKETC